MNSELKQVKQTLRAFMREHYTDERLAWLLAHARSGRLAFFSCCCFVGVVTADHALRGVSAFTVEAHYLAAKDLPGAWEAEDAYCRLSKHIAESQSDPQRIRRLISIIKAEMRRRESARSAPVPTVETPVHVSL